ncbi:MAG: InlB B-repeat-containing protein [bacterium]|nr:InlB B-repeat-containing protein [bacterium]
MKKAYLIIILLAIVVISLSFVFFSKIKEKKIDDKVQPVNNIEELLGNYKELNNTKISKDRIEFENDLNLINGEKISMWIYPNSKFLGWFEVKEENKIKYIDSVNKAIKKEKNGNGNYYIVITNKSNEVLGYIPISTTDNKIDTTKLDKIYIVTFDSNGGNEINDIEVKENDKITEPTPPIKDGYKFLYWEYESNQFNFDNKITRNITLTAIWEEEIQTYNEKNNDSINNINTNNNNTNNTIDSNQSLPQETNQNTQTDTADIPLIEEKVLGSYPIPERTAVCNTWEEEIDGEIISGKSMIESEVNKYVDMWINYYGYFYTPGANSIYIAEGLLVEFNEYGKIYVTDQLCNANYAAPLYQGSPNPYIKNYVKTYNVNAGDINPLLPYSNYKVKCTQDKCWNY